MKATTLAVTVLAAAVLVTTASAITTNGVPDGDTHPNVGGIMVPLRAPATGYGLVCSGTLVSPTIFVTASHCTAFLAADPRPDFVTFDSTDVQPEPDSLIPATPKTNPAFRGGFKADVSVMELATPVTDIAPAQLPDEVGELEELGFTQATKLTVVGYGTQEKTKGKPDFPFLGDRWYAIGSFNALTPEALKMSQNQAHGDGGACYGDSGGPTFLGTAPDDGDMVLAVTSTGDIPCYSTNVSARTDTPSARAFLESMGL